MSISEGKIDKLRAFGYTEVEAHFLYLVATHSGYFTVRQFLDFAHAKSGKRNARLVEKLFGLGHACARRYPPPEYMPASIINEQTGNLKRAQKFLGHSTIEMTADIYTHTSAEAEREAAVALERAIYGELFPVVPNFANGNNPAALN